MEVEPNQSIQLIEDCVVGGITKHELDDERAKETNSLDIMQNSKCGLGI